MSTQQEINDRLVATGVNFEDEATVNLIAWQVAMVVDGAQQTAAEGISVIAARDETTAEDVIAATVNLAEIVDGFLKPFLAQCSPLPDDENTPLTFRVRLASLTAFASLVVAAIANNDLVRPTRPAPTDPKALVSDSDMLWWSTIDLFKAFPAEVAAILSQETGLNFGEIR